MIKTINFLFIKKIFIYIIECLVIMEEEKQLDQL